MECKFGIKCFVSEHTRPRVAVKRTPEDFVVNEISTDGEVLVSGPAYKDASLEKGPPAAPSVPQIEQLVEVGASEAEAANILLLFERQTDEPVVLEGIFDKAQRTAIHSFFKLHFAQKLVTECPAPGKVRICRKGASGNHSNPGARPYDKRNTSDPDTLPFLQFVLEKRSMDTMDAVATMARAMGNRPVRNFSFAGIKDRRAVTSQRMVLRNGNPGRLLGLNAVLGAGGDRYLRVSMLERAADSLALGDLSGNRFCLRLHFLDDQVDGHVALSNARSLAARGFINYFGLQRFGTHAVSTDTVGEALLKRQYKEACDLIISERFPDVRALFLTADYAAALKRCPSFLHTERAVLEHLAGSGNDFEGALMAIPRETRMLYVHAWQSKVFNECASARIEKGMDVVAGDLVMVDNEVVPVTAGNRDRFTVYDVVLPLPGHSVSWPQSVVLSDYSVSTCDFCPKNKHLFDLPGAYRRLVIIPQDVQAELVTQGTLALQFSLPPSSYATMALREAFTCIEE